MCFMVADAHGLKIVNEYELHRDNHGVWCRWCGGSVETRYMGEEKARARCLTERCRKHSQAVRCIVNVMCNRGFMHGWFGDVDAEFRQEEHFSLMDMDDDRRKDWVEGNRSNLTHYCRVPEVVMRRAISVQMDD